MYLVPAWMFDSATWMLPTPSDEPFADVTARVLVELRFLIAGRPGCPQSTFRRSVIFWLFSGSTATRTETGKKIRLL